MTTLRRQPRSSSLGTANARAKLKVQKDPYWETLTRGTSLGYYKGEASQRFTELSWKQHIEPGIGRQLVSALDDAALKKWLKEMATKPPTVRAPKGKRKDAEFDPTDAAQVRARKASANRTWTMVKAALNWGRTAKLIPADQPTWWRDVKSFPLGEEPEPRMLQDDERQRLLPKPPH